MQTRQPRSDSKRNSVLKEAGLMELYKLEQNVIAITQRNKSKYEQIVSHDPNYNILFYQPNDKLRTEKAFKKELLLKQLDKLMDQETIFDKKLAQLNFMKEIEAQEQSKLLDREINPYQALRTVWAKHEKTAIEAKNSSDRLESLNWTIGIIKNTVISMKLKEEQLNQSNPSQVQSISHEKYEKLLIDYNRSLMVNQQLRQQILLLQQKIQAKSQTQNELEQQLKQKQKEIKNLKKNKQLADVDHKFVVAQLEQEIFLLSKKLEKLQKWKLNLEQTSIANNQQQFRLYFDILNQDYRIQDKLLSKTTFKNVSEIIEYLTQYNVLNSSTLGSSNLSQILNPSSFDQQNSEIIIPTLSLTEPNDQSPTRRKMPTDRPLNTKNLELQKFVGNKLVNLKFSKLPQAVNLNDETAKKFVRKNPVLSTSRRLETQYSERYIEPVSNSNN